MMINLVSTTTKLNPHPKDARNNKNKIDERLAEKETVAARISSFSAGAVLSYGIPRSQRREPVHS